MHVPENAGEERNPEEKCPAENHPNRAGATPLFGLSAAQKVFGVAPALGTVHGAALISAGQTEFEQLNPWRRRHHVRNQEGPSNSYARISSRGAR
jgi:hypothetical protein